MSYLTREIDNFLSQEELAEVWSAIDSQPRWRWFKFAGGSMFWSYGVFVSDKFSLTKGEWQHEPQWEEGVSPIWNKIYEKVKALAGPKFVMWRYIINGQTWGQEGSIHSDWPGTETNSETFILYINEFWNSDWGGDTVFYEVGNDHIERGRVSVEPGKLISYDSRILHKGSSPTEKNILRVTLAIQGKYE